MRSTSKYALVLVLVWVIAFAAFDRFEGFINNRILNRKLRTTIKVLFTLTFTIGITALGVTIGLMVRYAETGS